MDSGIDIVLTLITLVVAIVGTTLEHPSRKVKGFLIILAILASVGSIFKSMQDSMDKRFIKNALASLISPTKASYRQIVDEVVTFANQRTFNGSQCEYNDEGIACSFSSQTLRPQAVVLNRDDIAALYANELAGRSNDKLIGDLFDSVYDENIDGDGDSGERLAKKVGILGVLECKALWGDTHAHYEHERLLDATITCEDPKKTAKLYNLNLSLTGTPKSGELFESFRLQIYRQLNPQPTPNAKP